MQHPDPGNSSVSSRRPPSPARRLLLALSLATAATVLSAWVPSAISSWPLFWGQSPHSYTTVRDGKNWFVFDRPGPVVHHVAIYPDFTGQPAASFAQRAVPPSWARWRGAVPDDPLKFDHTMEGYMAWGFPRPAFYHRTDMAGTAVGARITGLTGRLTLLPAWTGREIVVPIIPIWSGIVTDVAAWFAVLSIPLVGIPLLKTCSRARRGACKACAYDLTGAVGPACQECGWPRVTLATVSP